MNKLREIIAYYCKHYPHKGELSKARLTKMVYLADWKSAVDRGTQISDIQWVYNHYGPYVPDVSKVSQEDDLFNKENTTNMFGSTKELVSLADNNYEPNLTVEEKGILDRIIEITKDKYWHSFIEFVYSTYPIKTKSQYSNLDLIVIAKEFNSSKKKG